MDVEYLDLIGNDRKLLTWGSTVLILHQTLLWWCNRGGWDERDIGKM